jgi:hypothetical protein
MFTERSRINYVAGSNQLILYDNSGTNIKQRLAIPDTRLDKNENHENNLGKENTLWSDIGVKLTSITTNRSTTCNKTSEFDILCNDCYT